MKKLKTFLAAISVALVALAGCSNNIEEIAQNSEYGTLVIGKDYRAINVDSIKKAVASVSGNGISTPIVSEAADVANGKGTVVISQIPVGNNRIITVQGYSDSSASAKVDGAVLRAVVNIKAGTNNLDEINWTTSRKGYVYNALFEADVNISGLSSDQMSAIEAATPDCDATNINLLLFVEDFKKGYDQLKESSAYILSAEKTLKRLTVEKADSSTEEAPAFNATAYYSDGKTEDVTASAEWKSSDSAVATVSDGKVTLVAAGETVVSASYTYGGVTKTGAKQTLTVTSVGGTIDKVYLVPNSNWTQSSATFEAYMWKGAKNSFVVMQKEGDKYVAECDRSLYENIIFLRCDPAKTANSWKNIWNRAAQQTIPEDKDTFTIDDGQWGGALETETGASGKWELTGSYSGGKLVASVESEIVTEPLPPTVTISPASGEIPVSNSIVVSYAENNAAVTSASVTLSGAVSKSYSLADFKNKTLTLKLSDLGITESGKTISVSASATNSEGTATAKATLTTIEKPAVADTFTWDNANVYFVLTDRFADGDSSNNNSYYRKRCSGDEDVATFHGGDIKGLTQNMDYFKKLGVNAIWITAPYEQAHGWVSGKNNKFPHFAFHGYYTLDWTAMDANMGTVDEFREFVQTCHANGIRVVMDIVMNHVGYNNTEDMITYNHGKTNHTEHGWLSKVNGVWNANDTVQWDNSLWDGSWWGPWIRSFGYEEGSEYGGSCGGLPDVKSEITDSVGMAPVLVTKWKTDSSLIKSKYYIPSVANADWNDYSGDYRTDKGIAPADYQVVWLSAWVREFGIDGFRCDTAKHVEKWRWAQLKIACTKALEAWRADSSKVDNSGAKQWDEAFWMTGEAWGWPNDNTGDYYGEGKFDSMIDFSFNGSNDWDGNYRTNYPTTSSWSTYIGYNTDSDSDNNGNKNRRLAYISSHDTGLTRVGDQYEVGTGLVLLPGGVQIYYGDESYREKAYTGCGDGDMFTRGDMNLEAAKSSPLVAHWGKVGNFRKYNPAVGAGTGSAYKRSYSGAAGANKVAIGVSGTSVDVSNLFDNGTTVYNWYDGTSVTVSNGKAVFTNGTGSMKKPILVSERNPADYGVTF